MKYKDLLRKEDNVEFPIKLDFITRSWGILKKISAENKEDYEKVFVGKGKKKEGSLWHVRNRIVHANYSLEKTEYEEFKKVLDWLIGKLKSELPSTEDEVRQLLIKHKKSRT